MEISKKKLLQEIASREHAFNVLNKKYELPELSSRACTLEYLLSYFTDP